MKKSKKIPKYNFGGLNDKDKTNVRNFLGNSFRATGDVGLSMLGMDNVIKDSDYKGNSAKGFMGYSDVMGGIGKSLLPAAANIVLPGSGTAIRAGQQVASSFNPEDNSLDKYDSNGNLIYQEQRNTKQIGNMLGSAGMSLGGSMGVFAMGGMNNIPNAEIESEENVVAPNGGFLQANGPSHEQGGVPVALPGNSMIFSDRLKLGKKTFAELNKVNNTNKEDKVLESNKYGTTSKRTAELMKFAKNKNSEALFNAQEALKQAKVEAYAKKMGVALPQAQEAPEKGMQYPNGGIQKYGDGGPTTPTLDNNSLIAPSIGQDPRYYTYQGNQVMKPGLRALNKDSDVTTDIGMDNYNQLLNTRAQVQNSKVNVNKQLPKFEYLNDPTKGSYDEQFNAYKKVYLPGFKYGGRKLPKYGNSVKFVPKMASEDQDADIVVPGSTVKSNPDFTEVLGPDSYNTFGKPLDTWEAARLNKSAWDADYLNNPNAARPVNTDENNKTDWQGIAANIAMGLANNAGNIYNLSRYDKPEVESYERMKATYLDPSAALRDAEAQTRRAEYNVRGASGGNAGTYLSNRVALNAQNTINKARIHTDYQNANAGIANSVGQYNNQLAQQEVIANAQNRARNRSGKGEAIGSLGSNIANQMMDNKKGNMDQETLQLMMKYYNDPQFKKYLEESGFNKKKTGK